MPETRTEFKLNNAPGDGITSVKFGPNSSQFLLVSSWDATVRLYDILTNNMRLKYEHEMAVLDSCFQVFLFILIKKILKFSNDYLYDLIYLFKDAVHLYSGDLSGHLKMYDVNANSATNIGTHDNAIKAVEYSLDVNTILTGSWDCTVKMWDIRSQQSIGTYSQPGKVFYSQ